MKLITFEMLTLSCCCYGMLSVDRASDENLMHRGDSIVAIPHQTANVLNRVKRQGGGGIIPFRPLFVYRQQQRERQERWKEIEARKKLREQLLQYQQNQQSYTSLRPSTPSISYSSPATTQYTSYNYPYTRYTSYSPSSSTYYNQYEYDKYPKDPYSNYYQNYYQNYYSGFDDYSYD